MFIPMAAPGVTDFPTAYKALSQSATPEQVVSIIAHQLGKTVEDFAEYLDSIGLIAVQERLAREFVKTIGEQLGCFVEEYATAKNKPYYVRLLFQANTELAARNYKAAIRKAGLAAGEKCLRSFERRLERKQEQAAMIAFMVEGAKAEILVKMIAVYS